MFILLMFSAMSYANTGLPDHRHITIKGTANIAAIPDLVVTFEASSIRNKALDAKKNVDRKVNKLFDVSEDGASTSNLLTEPYMTHTNDAVVVYF